MAGRHLTRAPAHEDHALGLVPSLSAVSRAAFLPNLPPLLILCHKGGCGLEAFELPPLRSPHKLIGVDSPQPPRSVPIESNGDQEMPLSGRRIAIDLDD